MLKWERKIVQWIDRYLIHLAWVLITLIALFIRRGGLWHVSFDFENQFYADAQGYLHTPFYTMLIWLVSHIPVTPIRTVKLIISMFDFGVAAAAVMLIRNKLGKEIDKRKLLTCYALLLISPVVIEKGLTWIHVDSVCLCAVLCAALAWDKKKTGIAWGLLGVAAAIQMQYGVIFIAMAIYCWVKNKRGLRRLWIGVAVVAGLTVSAAIWADLNARQCLYQLMNWLVINPGTGEVFNSLLGWLGGMAVNYGYFIATGMLIGIFIYPGLTWAAAVVQLLGAVYFGWILQYGYFW